MRPMPCYLNKVVRYATDSGFSCKIAIRYHKSRGPGLLTLLAAQACMSGRYSLVLGCAYDLQQLRHQGGRDQLILGKPGQHY